LQVHLNQDFLYPLNGAAGIRHQIPSLSPQGVRDANLMLKAVFNRPKVCNLSNY
jgi:hypothetical protein